MNERPTPDPNGPAKALYPDPALDHAARAILGRAQPIETVGFPWTLLLDVLIAALPAILRACSYESPEGVRRAARRAQRPILGAFARYRIRAALEDEARRRGMEPPEGLVRPMLDAAAEADDSEIYGMLAACRRAETARLDP